ncbi:MAG: metalloregulator ArsR/SmtB family transcription factor [Woeseiaceae bacterium]|nr:metalloregulator ArsR/SmtB family transcription factor [Woeseiaceae bacterium]
MDAVFKALADPTRRALLDRLMAEPGMTLTELIDGLDMRRQSATRHVAILESAGLVTSQRVGREKRHYLNPVPIADIGRRWIDKFSGERAQAVLNLKIAMEEANHE